MALGLSTLLPRLSPIQRRRHIPRLLLRKQQQQSNIPVTSSYRRLSKCRRQRLDSCSSRDSSLTDSSEDGCETALRQQQQQQLRQQQQPTVVVTPQIVLTLTLIVIVLALFSTKTWIKNQDWLSRASLFR